MRKKFIRTFIYPYSFNSVYSLHSPFILKSLHLIYTNILPLRFYKRFFMRKNNNKKKSGKDDTRDVFVQKKNTHTTRCPSRESQYHIKPFVIL